MGVVRIDDELQNEIGNWIKKNGNRFQFASISSFINSAIYEKLKRLKNERE